MNKWFIVLILAAATTAVAWSVPQVRAQEKLPPQVRACLQEKIGQTAFEEIFSGSRGPSADEKKKGESCFEGMIQQNKNIQVKSTVRECIQNIIGSSVDQVSAVSDDQRQQIETKCFGGRGGAIGFPDETKNCLRSVFGEARFNQILSGQMPTESEKMQAGPKCFGMTPPAGRGPADMPAEARSCVEGVLGKSMDEMTGPPSAEQQKLLEEKCFKGGGPGGPGGPGDKRGGPDMTAEQRACFQRIFGKSPEEMSGPLTADQEKKMASECFPQNQGGQQQGPPPGSGPGSRPPPGADSGPPPGGQSGGPPGGQPQ